MAGFTISALGGSRVQIGGPTGAFVVVVSGIVAAHGLDGLFMCTLMAGVILILLGVTGLGTAVKYIPRPVVIGFTNGIGVLIASTQIRDLFGLQTPEVPGEFLGRVKVLLAHAGTASGTATLLGVITVVAILVLRRVSERIPGSIIVLLAGSAAVFGAVVCPRTPSARGSVAYRAACRRCRCPALQAGSDPDAAVAGPHGRDAGRHRVTALGGGRRSNVRRSTRSRMSS